MKSHLRYTSAFNPSKKFSRLSGNRKSRKSSSVRGTSYQSLERRDLLTAFTVTTLQDSVAADGLVSLREAVEAANTNAAFGDAVAGEATGDVIRFASQLQGQTIQLQLGELDIYTSYMGGDGLRVIGDITLDAQNNSEILDLNLEGAGDVLLSGLTFINGNGSFSGAISVYGGDSGGIGFGTLRISQAEFRDNTADNGSTIEAQSANILIGRTTFTGNTGRDGGAIFASDSKLNIFQTTFTDNHATRDGGAIYLRSSGAPLGSASIVDSTFNDNTADDTGGAIYASLFSDGDLIANNDLFITRTTFNGNVAADLGGAVYFFGYSDSNFNSVKATITESNFIGNSAGSGGGLHLSDSTAYVADSLFEANAALDGSRFFSGLGGGIQTWGQLYLSDSRLLSNRAANGGGGISAGRRSVVVIADTLISENRAGSFGGGISGQEARLSILDTTVSFNRVNNPIVPAGTLTTSQTLVGGGLFASAEKFSPTGNPVDNLNVFISGSDFLFNFAGHAGGGVAVEGIDLRVVDSNFANNRVYTVLAPVLDSGETFSGGGGAIWYTGLDDTDSSLIVFRSIFRENVTDFGGQALNFGSRIPLLGGGISTIDSEAFLRESSFFANSSEGSGGALAQTGDSTLRSVDTDFIGNRAGTNRLLPAVGFDAIGSDDSPNGLGGAVYSQNTEAASPFPIRIFGGGFNRNTAMYSGGAIFAASTDPQASLFVRANSAGEGASFRNNRALGEDGGAFSGIGVSMNARDAFFAGNTARNGGAIFVEGGGELRLVFSDFRRNAARIIGGAVNFSDTTFVNFQNAFFNNTAINGPDFFEQT